VCNLKLAKPEIRDTKPAVISFRGTDEMDAWLAETALLLNFKGKSELLQDICEKFRAQQCKRNIPMTRLDRVQQTIGHIRALNALWSDNPTDGGNSQRTDRRMHKMIIALGSEKAKERAA
jgi:hypothetical protein